MIIAIGSPALRARPRRVTAGHVSLALAPTLMSGGSRGSGAWDSAGAHSRRCDPTLRGSCLLGAAGLAVAATLAWLLIGSAAPKAPSCISYTGTSVRSRRVLCLLYFHLLTKDSKSFDCCGAPSDLRRVLRGGGALRR